jgi:hypothetical protein
MTRDISVTGVFIVTRTLPPMDSVVDIKVSPPAPHSTSKNIINGRMKVRRVEDYRGGKRPSGFAAVGKIFATQGSPKDTELRSQVGAEGREN